MNQDELQEYAKAQEALSIAIEAMGRLVNRVKLARNTVGLGAFRRSARLAREAQEVCAQGVEERQGGVRWVVAAPQAYKGRECFAPTYNAARSHFRSILNRDAADKGEVLRTMNRLELKSVPATKAKARAHFVETPKEPKTRALAPQEVGNLLADPDGVPTRKIRTIVEAPTVVAVVGLPPEVSTVEVRGPAIVTGPFGIPVVESPDVPPGTVLLATLDTEPQTKMQKTFSELLAARVRKVPKGKPKPAADYVFTYRHAAGYTLEHGDFATARRRSGKTRAEVALALGTSTTIVRGLEEGEYQTDWDSIKAFLRSL